MPAACSISSSVVKRLKENRIELLALSLLYPILNRILEGSKDPDEHAEP